MALEKFRLTDINVEEVSVVDRAANQRRFLVVKSEGGSKPGAEVIVGKDGALTVAKAPGVPPMPPASPAETAPAVEPDPATKPAEEPALSAPTMRIAMDVKAEIARRIDLVLAAFEEIRTMLGSAEVVEGAVEVPQEILGALNAALDVLETGGPDESVAKRIEKGLKQFSRTRMASLRTALGELTTIVNEIDGTKVDDPAPEPATDPAPEPDAFADLAKSEDLKSLETQIAKGLHAVVGVIERVSKKITSDLTEHRESIEKSVVRAEISTTEVASSNASEETPGGKASSGGGSWPLDMNQKAPHAKA